MLYNQHNYPPESAAVSRERGTVWDTDILHFTESRRRVSVVEFSAEHLEKEVECHRSSIFSAKSSRGLAKIVIIDVKGGGGRFVRGDSTLEIFVKGAFPPGDPNRGV